MKTLIKKITLLLLSIFCLACAPNIPEYEAILCIHQIGWGDYDKYNYNNPYSDYDVNNKLVTETMQKSYDGLFSYRGHWKGGDVVMYDQAPYNGYVNVHNPLTIWESEIVGASNLYWGEIII